MSEKQIFTLQQVASSIRKTIEQRYAQSYWVKAEMHKLNLFPSGHAFPELVQKEGEKIIAQLSGTIWKQQLDRINQRFISRIITQHFFITKFGGILIQPINYLCLGDWFLTTTNNKHIILS